MQLIFKRNNENLSIEIKDGVSTIEFNYVDMIKKFLNDNVLEETVFEGDITEEEKVKITDMVKKINNALIKEENVKENN